MPFPSCFEPHYESEAKCKVFIKKISFHSYVNKTNSQTKSFALSRVFTKKFTATRKWPIQKRFQKNQQSKRKLGFQFQYKQKDLWGLSCCRLSREVNIYNHPLHSSAGDTLTALFWANCPSRCFLHLKQVFSYDINQRVLPACENKLPSCSRSN